MNYFTIKGTPINEGDIIKKESVTSYSTGAEIKQYKEIVITKDNMKALAQAGIIKVGGTNTTTLTEEMLKTHCGICYAAGLLAYRIKLDYEFVLDFLDLITEINPSLTVSLLLKELAIELDKQYSDHISKSPIIYYVSNFNGDIKCINNPKKIKSFKNFAAFRTQKDVEMAVKALKELWPSVYGK